MRTVKAQTSLCGCTGSSEPSLFIHNINELRDRFRKNETTKSDAHVHDSDRNVQLRYVSFLSYATHSIIANEPALDKNFKKTYT